VLSSEKDGLMILKRLKFWAKLEDFCT